MQEKETRKNAFLYCKFRDDQFASYDRYVKGKGILINTFLVFNALYYAKSGYTQNELCEITHQSKQVISAIIKNLSGQGMIAICSDDADKRKKVLSLTEHGREYCKESVTHITQAEDEAMGMMSKEEQALLVQLSRKFTKNLIELINRTEDE